MSSGAGTVTVESPEYLRSQLLTYLGNKRGLAAQLERAVLEVRARLGGRKLVAVDLFSGSGFVSRLLKQHSSLVIANDLEPYAEVVSRCYLTDAERALDTRVAKLVAELNQRADAGEMRPGFISDLYSPSDDRDIQVGERVFYTNDNARRLDFFAQEIASLEDDLRPHVLAPLLSCASVHANTSGVFKGFYKDKRTGIGKFGGARGDALARILQPIRLEPPVRSRFLTESCVFRRDANELLRQLPASDLIYVDPPYNQHPYGSNYFMLNLLVDYQRPQSCSDVSGIPAGWNRSGFNVKRESLTRMQEIFECAPARFLLVSFNAEGHIDTARLRAAMQTQGRVDEMIVPYNTFRGSRNLRARPIHVDEHLFLLDREG